MKITIILALLIATTGSALALTNKKVAEAYRKSNTYEKMEKNTDAIKALLPVYKQNPDDYTVNVRLGWLYYLSEKYKNSLFHYEKAVRLSPGSLEAKLGKILPFLAQQKYSEAAQEAFKVVSIDRHNYYGNLRFLYALRMQNKSEAAEKIARKMLTIYPSDVSFLVEYGLLLQSIGAKKKAGYIFRQVLIFDPENVSAKEFIK